VIVKRLVTRYKFSIELFVLYTMYSTAVSQLRRLTCCPKLNIRIETQKWGAPKLFAKTYIRYFGSKIGKSIRATHKNEESFWNLARS